LGFVVPLRELDRLPAVGGVWFLGQVERSGFREGAAEKRSGRRGLFTAIFPANPPTNAGNMAAIDYESSTEAIPRISDYRSLHKKRQDILILPLSFEVKNGLPFNPSFQGSEAIQT
jgi:hypothetical protein